jgi:hypothetical protein
MTSSKKLDREQPYGTIYGDEQGRAFEQEGVYFRGDGTVWDEETSPLTPFEPLPEPALKPGLLPPKKKKP